MSADTNRLYIPALAPLYDRLSEYAYPLVRIAAGLLLMPHGAQKLFGMLGGGGIAGTTKYFESIGLGPAGFLAYYVGAIEFFGGALIAIGLLTRPVAALAAINMLVAAFYVHYPVGFFWTARGIEYPLLWSAMLLVIAIRGGGPYSVDSRMAKEF
jgi:putative oxidoreductase